MDPTTETPSDVDVRLSALDRAINFHAARDCDPDECVATAQKFERYLTDTGTRHTVEL